jgi:hypothetical protein
MFHKRNLYLAGAFADVFKKHCIEVWPRLAKYLNEASVKPGSCRLMSLRLG